MIVIIRGRARGVATSPPAFAKFGRVELVSHLVRTRRVRRYLEIGCQSDACFKKIQCAVKVGVDPTSGGTLRMTSDAFFRQNREKFDLIFIDGDHRHPQVARDIDHAVRALSPGGLITMHDCLLPSANYESPDLSGTVWRAFAVARERNDLDAVVAELPADPCGLGLILKRSNSARIKIGRSADALTYQDFVRHGRTWLRQMSIPRALEFLARERTVR